MAHARWQKETKLNQLSYTASNGDSDHLEVKRCKGISSDSVHNLCITQLKIEPKKNNSKNLAKKIYSTKLKTRLLQKFHSELGNGFKALSETKDETDWN